MVAFRDGAQSFSVLFIVKRRAGWYPTPTSRPPLITWHMGSGRFVDVFSAQRSVSVDGSPQLLRFTASEMMTYAHNTPEAYTCVHKRKVDTRTERSTECTRNALHHIAMFTTKVSGHITILRSPRMRSLGPKKPQRFISWRSYNVSFLGDIKHEKHERLVQKRSNTLTDGGSKTISLYVK